MEDESKKRSLTGLVVVVWGLVVVAVIISIIVNAMKYPEIMNAIKGLKEGSPIGLYAALCVLLGAYFGHFDVAFGNWMEERKEGRINKKAKKVTT